MQNQNREDLLKKIKTIEEKIFLIDMIDKWDEEDSDTYIKLMNEKFKILEELAIIDRKEGILTNGNTIDNKS